MKWFRLADFAPVWSACATWRQQTGGRRVSVRNTSLHPKAPEKTGALQKLRQYRGVCEPRASVLDCPFCRFLFSDI